MKLTDMSQPGEYPCGLRLTLNEAQLQALGLELPPAGAALHIEAMATVTRSSTEDPDADGDIDFICVELQLTQLGVEADAEAPEPENTLTRRSRQGRRLYKTQERDVGGTPEKGEFGAFNRRVGG